MVAPLNLVRSKQNGLILTTTTLLLFTLFTPSLSAFELFPEVEVTLYNELDREVWYMCSFQGCNRTLQVLESKGQVSWAFPQVAFPLHWVYLYIDEKVNGFFWAYAVRLRCNKCFWRVNKFPYLYRSDRNRWERQALYPPHLNNKSIKPKH